MHENGVGALESEISGFTLGWPGSDYSHYHTQEDRIHEREVGPIIRKNQGPGEFVAVHACFNRADTVIALRTAGKAQSCTELVSVREDTNTARP
jgi:hypothetical protein